MVNKGWWMRLQFTSWWSKFMEFGNEIQGFNIISITFWWSLL